MIELGIQVRQDWDFLRKAARWAKESGVVALGMPDHYLQRGSLPEGPAYDSLTLLSALAVETNLELSSLVSPVTFRHPAVYYKMGVTLDEISGGRFTLGLGAGWMDEEFEMFGIPYPPLAERMELLEEAMAYLRAAITPDAVPFEGKHYTLADFDPHPRPINLRLMAGGEGKAKARRITALYADEYNLYVCPPERYREIVDKTSELAVEAGRRPEDIFWSSAGPAFAARKESDYRTLLGKLAELTGQTTERIEEAWTEKSIPHGSGSKASEMVAALAEAGCQRYYLQLFALELSELDLIVEAYRG